ncbi:Crp/Fnr family transcriptional regulator [Listeria booriae]|uniref:Crp/Fnr family transcriptional regulator n=1 Tax=Listeria booriae TaxID=1552123 RepID=UPI0016277954|nr:Crp/Fnr family transcriptional regulator [Listeria booriae]MBC2306322.1 Crp/Fnr family transcriptional regulator [Listeria booriae]
MMEVLGIEVDENILKMVLFSNDLFKKYSKKRVLPAKKVIDSFATDYRSFIYIKEGLVSVSINLENNSDSFSKSRTISFSGHGEFVGFFSLLGDSKNDFQLETVSEVTAYFIDLSFVLRVIEKSGWSTSILLKEIDKLTHFLNLDSRIRLLSIEKRLAVSLLYLESKSRGEIEGLLPEGVSQYHIANYCQASREYIALLLAKFESEGLIQSRPKPIKILDRERLEKRAGISNISFIRSIF